MAFAEGDPYARAGIVERIEITALASRFQAHRIDPYDAPGSRETTRPGA